MLISSILMYTEGKLHMDIITIMLKSGIQIHIMDIMETIYIVKC